MTQTNIFNGHYAQRFLNACYGLHVENLHSNVSGKRSVISQKVRVISAEGVGLEKTDTG